MKKLTLIFLLLSKILFGQSVEILPTAGTNNGNLKFNKNGIGLAHSSSDGVISMGSYVTSLGAFIQTHSNHPLFFSTNNSTAKLTLGTNGFLGIGTTTPQHPLTFPDQTGEKISLLGGNTNSGANHYGIGIQGALFQIYSGSQSDDIAFGYGRSAAFVENVRIKGNGNMGIGVAPAEKLHVNGNIRASGLAGIGTRPVGADANGTLVTLTSTATAFSVSSSFSNLIPGNGVEELIDLNIENYDTANSFDNVNNYQFTAPSSGIYHFTVNIAWQGNAIGKREIILRNHNNTYLNSIYIYPSNSQILIQNYSVDLNLTAGTGVRLFLSQDSGSSLFIYSAYKTLVYEPILSGFKVN